MHGTVSRNAFIYDRRVVFIMVEERYFLCSLTLLSCCLCFRLSASQVSLDRLTYCKLLVPKPSLAS